MARAPIQAAYTPNAQNRRESRRWIGLAPASALADNLPTDYDASDRRFHGLTWAKPSGRISCHPTRLAGKRADAGDACHPAAPSWSYRDGVAAVQRSSRKDSVVERRRLFLLRRATGRTSPARDSLCTPPGSSGHSGPQAAGAPGQRN